MKLLRRIVVDHHLILEGCAHLGPCQPHSLRSMSNSAETVAESSVEFRWANRVTGRAVPRIVRVPDSSTVPAPLGWASASEKVIVGWASTSKKSAYVGGRPLLLGIHRGCVDDDGPADAAMAPTVALPSIALNAPRTRPQSLGVEHDRGVMGVQAPRAGKGRQISCCVVRGCH